MISIMIVIPVFSKHKVPPATGRWDLKFMRDEHLQRHLAL